MREELSCAHNCNVLHFEYRRQPLFLHGGSARITKHLGQLLTNKDNEFLHHNRVILKMKYNQMWAFHKARYEAWAYDEENNKRCTNPPHKNLDKWAGLAPAYTREAQGFGRQVSQRRHEAAPDHIPRWLSRNNEHTKLLWICQSSWATWKWSSKPQMLL